MRNSEITTIMIDRYLRGELTEDQKTEFFQLLEQNGSLEEEFLLKQSIQDHFANKSQIDKKKLLQKIELDEFSKNIAINPTTKFFQKRKRIYTIASVAAAIALIISLFNPLSTLQPTNDLLLNNFEGYPSSTIKRGTQFDKNTTKTDAYVLYEMGEYLKSAPLLEKIAKTGDAEAYLYAGIAYLGINEYSKSIKLLNKYKSSITSHPEVPNLYIAISQQMLGPNTESIKELERLAKRSDFIGTQSKKYLKDFQK